MYIESHCGRDFLKFYIYSFHCGLENIYIVSIAAMRIYVYI